MKATRAPVIGARDQAAGLRNLFKDGASTRTLSLLVSDCAHMAPTLALGLARTLITQGRRVLVIDETPLDASRPQPTPLYRVQYDLGQGLTGTTPLAGCIKSIQPNLYFASAARIAKHLKQYSGQLHLPNELRSVGLEIDYLLIIGGPDHAHHSSVYGGDQLIWLLCAASHAASDFALDGLLNQCAPYQGRTKNSALPTLMVGNDQIGPGKSSKQAPFDALKKRFAQYSKLRPDYLGWISATAEADETPIPVSLLQDLSRRLLV